MRYVSNKIVSFSIRVKGSENSVRINFQACSTGGSTYITDKQPVIEAMESSDMFGRVYRRAPECASGQVTHKRRPRAARQEPKLKDVQEVGSWQEAAEYLSSQFGISESSVITPDSILNKAAENGVRFPNIN